MANVLLPFLMSMLLGRTIDLRSYRIGGGNIYDDVDYVETQAASLKATYNVLQEESFPYTFFGLPEDIVLKIKAGHLSSSSGAMGLDGLLKDTSWKFNSVIVGVALIYRTVDRTLTVNATLLSSWKDRIPATQTHYAEKLMYGGWCVVLFRFKCDIPGDVRAVRKSLTEVLGTAGTLDSKIPALWKKAQEAIEKNDDIRGYVEMSTQVYSTVNLEDEMDSPEKLFKLIKDFPQLIGPLGRPLYMNLKPLYDLDKSFPQVESNLDLVNDLEKVDAMSDDVRNTKIRVVRWIQETMTSFTDEEDEKIENLLSILNDCIRAFSKVADDASLFKSMDKKNLEASLKKYQSGLPKGTGTYDLAFKRLKEEIDAQCGRSFLRKIRGLLKVYSQEADRKGEVEGGLQECQRLCVANERCRAIGYAQNLTELDLTTGNYFKKQKQCWIYYRSTSTAIVETPNGYSGEMHIYDRNCY